MKFKFEKVLFSLFIMFLSTMVVYADVPSKIRINGDNLYYINASQMLPNVDTTDGANDGQNLSIKLTTNEDVTYCVNADKYLYNGTLDYDKGNKLNNKILYVMENGYPNKSITGNNDKDYFITNLAIWYLLDPSSNKLSNYDFPNGKYKNTASDTVARAYTLASAANNYTLPANTISVSNSVNMTQSGNNYVTADISVTLSNNATSYSVTLGNNAPTGAVITDTSGNAKTSFNKGESFKVKVPAGNITSTTSFSVTVTAIYNDKAVYVYNPTGHDAQAVAMLVTENSTKDANLTVGITIQNSSSISVVKYILGTQTPLSGAEFLLKYPNGDEDTWNSWTTPHTISGLANGRYTLTETVTPNGYVDDNKVVVFDINDGVVTKVSGDATINGTTIIIYNEKIPVRGEAVVSKQDDSGKGLAGAKLELYNSKGNKIYSWTSKETPEVISNLEPGTYTIKEVSAPKKYVKSKNNVTFTVREDGTVAGTIVIKNYPDEVKENAQTGGVLSMILVILGFASLGYAAYLLLKNKESNV